MTYKPGAQLKFVVRDNKMAVKYSVWDVLKLCGGFLAAYTVFYMFIQLF